ncbi:effector caspase-like protein [Leptotrombidium deliense]|uniref:Effector caspase-like protein n=1 Tax=Leptotrombidium deliense TaxID=299467 RepID=A0A443S6D4_9ACAR|nr:effector caspase-like protein [Leptotrombidium deliense]
MEEQSKLLKTYLTITEVWRVDEVADEYSFQRGHCLIFNQKIFNLDSSYYLSARDSTNRDKDEIAKFFTQLCFMLKIFEASSYPQIMHVLNAYANNNEDYNCLVCFCLTHGRLMMST